MARIFYWRDTGRIYGVRNDGPFPVKPDGTPKIVLPDGVDELTTPDVESSALAWPVQANGSQGRETTTKVLAGKLVARDDVKVTPDEDLSIRIKAAATLEELKDALVGAGGIGRLKARLK